MRLILYGTKTDRDEFMCSVTALPGTYVTVKCR